MINSGNRLGYGVPRDHGSGVNLFDMEIASDIKTTGISESRGGRKARKSGFLPAALPLSLIDLSESWAGRRFRVAERFGQVLATVKGWGA